MMKRKMLSAISVILVISLMVPFASLAQSSDKILNKPYSSDNAVRVLEKKKAVIEVSQELIDLRNQAANLVKQIKDTLKELGGFKEIKTDATYLEIKALLDSGFAQMKDLDIKAKLKEKFEEFKKSNTSGKLVEAEKSVNEIIVSQQDKIDALKALVEKLKAGLEKAKALAASKGEVLAQVKAYKDQAEVLKKTIQANHLAIVKMEIGFRSVNSKIIATISANKDVFTDEKLTQLEAVLTELKTLRDDLHKLVKNGVKDAINSANTLRRDGKYAEALASLQKAVQLQEAKKVALTDAKTKAQGILDEIDRKSVV